MASFKLFRTIISMALVFLLLFQSIPLVSAEFTLLDGNASEEFIIAPNDEDEGLYIEEETNHNPSLDEPTSKEVHLDIDTSDTDDPSDIFSEANEQSHAWSVQATFADGGSSWTFVDEPNGLFYDASSLKHEPAMAVYKDELYVIWIESTPFSRIRVKKYNGNEWVSADLETPLNKFEWSMASFQSLIEFEDELYAAWMEQTSGMKYSVRVKKYNGENWTFVDGDEDTGLVQNSANDAIAPTMAVKGNDLFLVYMEAGLVRVLKYDKSNHSWNLMDGGGLNQHTQSTTSTPSVTVLDDRLYVSWSEQNGIRVARYVEEDSSWELLAGNENSGLNRVALMALFPKLIAYHDKLYLIWQEGAASTFRIYAARYDEPVWTFVDGGEDGLNMNADNLAYNPKAAVSNARLYITWSEASQVRVKSLEGESWISMDGGETTGLNHDPTKSAQNPALIDFKGELYAAWVEDGRSVRVAKLADDEGGDLPSIPQTYKVTYMGNKSDGGYAPIDHVAYEEGDSVTVLGNTGNLVRTGYLFTGWNTQADGNGTNYTAGSIFEMGSENLTLYAKWAASSTDGGGSTEPTPVPNPSPSPSPSPVPETPSTDPLPEASRPTPSTPGTEIITVLVETGNIGSGAVVAQTRISRTTDANGKISDRVVLSTEQTKEVVQSIMNAGGHTARIVIPNNHDVVSEVLVHIEQGAIGALISSELQLEIYTDNARILIPYLSLNQFKDDVYFRVVPVKEEKVQQEIKYRIKAEQIVQRIAHGDKVHVLARPMIIETNLQNRPVTLFLPLRDVDLPTQDQERAALLADLAVFIEHSDGEKELVHGRVVEYKQGELGIEIEVDKFSTFTILQIEGWRDYVNEPVHQAYIQGYSDGTFKPQNSVTRAEIATMIARLVNKSLEGSKHSSYADVSQSHWAVEEIELMKQLGLMTGDHKARFNPSNFMTRAEMAMIVARYTGKDAMKKNQEPFSYLDVPASHWAASPIEAATQAGIVKGYGNDTFRPNEYVSRAEAVTILNRLFGRVPRSNEDTLTFPDVHFTYWAFKEIEEAATDHFHVID